MPCVFNHLATRIHSTFNTRRQCRQRATPMWHAGDDLTLHAPRPRVITGSVFIKQRRNTGLKGIPLAGVVFRVEYEGLNIVCIDASDLGLTFPKPECDPVATQSKFWIPEATMSIFNGVARVAPQSGMRGTPLWRAWHPTLACVARAFHFKFICVGTDRLGEWPSSFTRVAAHI